VDVFVFVEVAELVEVCDFDADAVAVAVAVSEVIFTAHSTTREITTNTSNILMII
jgi:hypothetical protein